MCLQPAGHTLQTTALIGNGTKVFIGPSVQ
jgi:hypothetical protein